VPSNVRITWDQAAIRLDCTSESTAVGRAMSTMADHLVNEMKRRCPVSPRGRSASGGGRWPARKSGTLRNSIRKVKGASMDQVWLVGPAEQLPDGTFLGELIERGTPPHDINSTGPWPLRNPDTGQVFGPHVRHPGTSAQPFIAPAAQAMSGYRIDIRK
jgi:hypothetical protein